MAKFNETAFKRANFTPQTGTVPIPDYARSVIDSEDGEDPVWQVRGMTGSELRQVEQQGSGEMVKIINQVSAMVGGGGEADAGAIDLEAAKQIAALVVGCVNPPLERPQAVLLCESMPLLAALLNKKIWDLTGVGPQLGEPGDFTPGAT